MMQFEIGMFVKSRQGRDVNNIYVVVRTDEKSVYGSDGNKHPVQHPKRKNEMHIERVDHTDRVLTEKIRQGTVKDEEIKYALKQFRKACVK